MTRTRMFLKSALLAFATILSVSGSTPTNAAAPSSETNACYPGCTKTACDKACGGPGTGVCEFCRCACVM